MKSFNEWMSYSRYPILLVAFAMLMLSDGCGDDDRGTSSNPPDDKQVLVPLVAGHRWVYEITAAYPPSRASAIYLDTLTIVGEQVWKGAFGYVLHSSLRDRDVTAWRLEADGLWEWSVGMWYWGETGDTTSEAWHLHAPYPAEAGAHFVVIRRQRTEFDAEIKDFIRVTDTDSLVTVPAGQFRCVVYDHELVRDPCQVCVPSRFKDLYAVGVGLVTRSFEYGDQGEWAVVRLVRFLPKS